MVYGNVSQEPIGKGKTICDRRTMSELLVFYRRTSNLVGKLFYRLIQQAVQISPQTYEKLISLRDGVKWIALLFYYVWYDTRSFS